MHQAQHPGLAFNQSADSREVVVADDEISFPVALFETVGWWERRVVDGQYRLLKPRSPALLALVGSAMITTGAQR